jgi:membrane protease YdiL (CAAX protease family)
MSTDRAHNFFHGNWVWFVVVVAMALAAPLVEELVFRCFLLPRTRAAFASSFHPARRKAAFAERGGRWSAASLGLS